jgi:hypothetical protein
MTEAEWLASNDPKPMWGFVLANGSERKLRLFSCGRCRSLWHLLPDHRSKKVVEIVERYVDGSASDDERESARADAFDALDAPNSAAGNYFQPDAHADMLDAIFRLACVAAFAADATPSTLATWSAFNFENISQPTLLRCIFGNPFNPTIVRPSWLAPPVVRLAQKIYEDRTFNPDRMKALADALAQAGCMNQDILQHCRQREGHVRGCWVVDSILGKK